MSLSSDEVDRTPNEKDDDTTDIPDSATAFLSTLSASDLELIQGAFHKSSTDSKEKFMDIERFCDTLASILSKGQRSDFCGLFNFVDVSREGLISWDLLSNHLLLDYYEREDRIKISQIPQWQSMKIIYNPHKTFICSILIHATNSSRYCTVSKDGLLSILDDRFEVKRTHQIQTNQEVIRSKDLWITDAVLMVNINKIAFTTTSKEIWIYDLSGKHEFVCQYKIHGMNYIPLCLSYWYNTNNPTQSILVVGDTNGDIHTLFFSAMTTSLFDKPLNVESSQDVCYPVHIDDIITDRFPSVSCIHYHAHTAWVRQVYYVAWLNCFISCSTTSADSVVLAWLGKSRKDVRLTKFRIPLGVIGFDYQARLNLIATAGIDNHVCLWNPYVVSKPVGILRGHMQVIVMVKFIHAKSQLVSLCKDKVLRVWDVNLQICLQRLTGVFPKTIDINISMFFDQEKSCLLTSFNNQLVLLKMKTEIKDRVVSHDSPIMDLVYNEKFAQVVSVCESSCINIWLLSTGQKVKHIPKAHGDAEITAVTLDNTQTKILTAGTDGLVKIWDINGHCHHELVVENGSPCEINQIIWIKRMILAVGWSKFICNFPTTEMKTYELLPVLWKGKKQHSDDILVADFLEPRTLVTASYDGDIVFWNTNTHNSTRKITNEHPRTKSIALPPLSSVGRMRQNSISRLSTPNGSRLSRSRGSFSRSYSRNDNGQEKQQQKLVAVTSISFLKKRNNHDPRTADIYSCHSDGTVRFWNSLTCEKINEFEVFDCFGAIVSCVDSINKYLAVGGDNGMCKIYNIEDYCINKSLIFNAVTDKSDEPVLYTTFKAHTDAITSVKFVEKSGILFILTCSCDCSVALHRFDQLVGIFGQMEHWNINDETAKDVASEIPVILEQEEIYEDGVFEAQPERKSLLSVPARVERTSSETDHVSLRLDTNGTVVLEEEKLIETWDRTVLGKAYQETRKLKRDRQQPYDLESIDTKFSSDTQTRSYRCLKMKAMNETSTLQKRDFITPSKLYFVEKEERKVYVDDEIPLTINQLKLRHDEKSIFPKYILDMETKMKAAHKLGGRTSVFSRLSTSPTRSGAKVSRSKPASSKNVKWKQISEDISSPLLTDT